MIEINTDIKKISYELTLLDNMIKRIKKDEIIYDYEIEDFKELIKRIEKKVEFHKLKVI